MTVKEELDNREIYCCPECRCSTGDDWEYKDFSNKNIIVCPQCKSEIIHEEVERMEGICEFDFKDSEGNPCLGLTHGFGGCCKNCSYYKKEEEK